MLPPHLIILRYYFFRDVSIYYTQSHYQLNYW